MATVSNTERTGSTVGRLEEILGSDASLLACELKSRRVLVSARHGNLRVSTHFYNSENDLDRLREELQRVL